MLNYEFRIAPNTPGGNEKGGSRGAGGAGFYVQSLVRGVGVYSYQIQLIREAWLPLLRGKRLLTLKKSGEAFT